MSIADEWLSATQSALVPLADPERAEPMAAYMKDVAPFLGIPTPARRSALRNAWRSLPPLDVDDVAAISRRLWVTPEREYQYAACDLLARHARGLPGAFLAAPIESLVTDRAWWDTVDSLGSAVITPLVDRHPEQVDLMWQWWDSSDRWLVRAALQHQRGLKDRTDMARLLQMCDRYCDSREFFIAKAVGWALRDAAHIDPQAVRRFVDDHPGISRVASREAERGLVAGS